MTLFTRTKVPAIAPVPVMPGFKVPRLPREKTWQRRALYTSLATVCFVYSFLMLLLPMQLKISFATPLIVMLLLIVWALPTTDKAPGPLAKRLFWAYSTTLLLWPDYLAITLPGLPWITAARLFAAPMVLLLLIHASRSQPFKDFMGERLRAIKPLWIFVAVFAVIQVVSISLSPQPFLTINRVINSEIMWTGMFFATVWVLRDEKKIERWIIAYVVMTFLLGLLAIWESRVGGVIWANSVPSFLRPADPSVDRILAGSYRLTGQYRVQATSTTPLSFAELMALCVPFLLYLIHRYPKPLVILACLILDGLIIFCLIQADARLGFVGLLIGHVLYFLFFAIEKRIWQPRSLTAAVLVLSIPVSICCVVLSVLFIGRVRVKVLGGGQHESSNDARIEQMNIAFEKIWASPVFGFGSGQGGPRIGYMNGDGVITIDSYYLTVLMDYGFLGFFTFYGMLLYAIVVCTKISFTSTDSVSRKLAAVIAIFVAEFFVIKSVLSQEANHPLIFIALGAVAALAFRAKARGGRLA